MAGKAKAEVRRIGNTPLSASWAYADDKEKLEYQQKMQGSKTQSQVQTEPTTLRRQQPPQAQIQRTERQPQIEIQKQKNTGVPPRGQPQTSNTLQSQNKKERRKELADPESGPRVGFDFRTLAHEPTLVREPTVVFPPPGTSKKLPFGNSEYDQEYEAEDEGEYEEETHEEQEGAAEGDYGYYVEGGEEEYDEEDGEGEYEEEYEEEYDEEYDEEEEEHDEENDIEVKSEAEDKHAATYEPTTTFKSEGYGRVSEKIPTSIMRRGSDITPRQKSVLWKSDSQLEEHPTKPTADTDATVRPPTTLSSEEVKDRKLAVERIVQQEKFDVENMQPIPVLEGTIQGTCQTMCPKKEMKIRNETPHAVKFFEAVLNVLSYLTFRSQERRILCMPKHPKIWR